MENVIKVKITDEKLEGYLPCQHSEGALGLDIKCPENVKLTHLNPMKINLKVIIECPSNIGLIIMARSSFAAKGMVVLGGVIDSDYRGEIHAMVVNLQRDKDIIIEKGDRFLQLVPVPRMKITTELTQVISSSKRGHGKFGSTGTK